MPLITFSNPEYKDKPVHAVAGSFTETVLKIANTNRIPIIPRNEDVVIECEAV